MTGKKKQKAAPAKGKTAKGKPPRRKKKTAREIVPQGPDLDRELSQAIVPREPPREPPKIGDLPSVTLRNSDEVFHHFSRIDPRLAEAWKRDVVVHEGPITLRRIMSSVRSGYGNAFGGATHYAYVDKRLLWYLTHDPSDPLGARWDGYLASARDAPPGTTAVRVGLDIVAKKVLPQIEGGCQ